MTQEELLTLVAVVIVVGCIPFVVAALRSPGSATIQNSDKASTVSTALAPEAAFKAVIGFAHSNNYSVASINESALSLCLEESASITGYGFFFPISVSTGAEGGAVVEIGTKRKVYAVGPIASRLVGRSHEKCVSGIRAALFATT